MNQTSASICRVCANSCPIRVTTHDGRVLAVDGDPQNPIYHGYTCVKGRNQWRLYGDPRRLVQSLKRSDDGEFLPIPTADAIGEIAGRLDRIIDRHGPRSVAMFWGNYFGLDDPLNLPMADAFMKALGSPMTFTPNTIDQPGKILAKGLLGVWMAPGQAMHDPDVVLLLGNNPLVSHQGPVGHPGDFVKNLRRHGATLIVIDPRRTETAKRASLYIQPRPGQDVAILAGIIRLIIEENLYDAQFVAEHVTGLEQLRAAVEPFSPSFVAERADIPGESVVAAAHIFGGPRRGYAFAGTGPNMSAHGTLVEYLILCLDTICGHWMREGERVRNALSLVPSFAQMAKAQALPSFPTFGYGDMRVRGLTATLAGMPTGAMAEEILLPGDGQVRALMSLGGNPASSVPDQGQIVDALRSLDLLVQVDVQMSPTATLADYVIAPKLAFEVPGTNLLADFLSLYANGFGLRASFAHYTAALVKPPEGSDVIEQWKFLYHLAQRMRLQLQLFPGVGELLPGGTPTALDMAKDYGTDELLTMVHAGSRISLEEVKRHPNGALFPHPPVYVAPKDQGWDCRLDVANEHLMSDLAAFASRTNEAPADFPFRLISRRMMHTYNSPTFAMPPDRPSYNPAFLNPADLARLAVTPGDIIEIESERAAIRAVAEADPTVRPGTLSMSHSFGSLPDSNEDVRCVGSNPGRLVANDAVYDRYSGQPRMSNIPVRIMAVDPMPQ